MKNAEQIFILERMVKIVPRQNRLYELLKYDKYWHRYDGRVTEECEKTLCGGVFKSPPDSSDNNYKCNTIENFKDLPICPSCLKIWYEEVEETFNEDQLLGEFKLSLWDENALFVQMFIENAGYDKLNDTVNNLLFDYLQKNNLLSKILNKTQQ